MMLGMTAKPRVAHSEVEIIACPWAKSDMTPCAARDGGLAMFDSGSMRGRCVGCEYDVAGLFAELAKKHILKGGSAADCTVDPARDIGDQFKALVAKYVELKK
jgi:hypothetical protein